MNLVATEEHISLTSKPSLPSDTRSERGRPSVGLHQTGYDLERTRLCRWMVYSRATTSAMALLPDLPAGALLDFDLFGIAIDYNSVRDIAPSVTEYMDLH